MTSEDHSAAGEAKARRRRDYDVVLFGAGGFVGRQTVRYFADHLARDERSRGVRWAIAGRNRQTLEAAKAASGAAESVDVLVVDGTDRAAVDQLAARTRVVLSTAGPFALYSDAIVEACVRRQTHYLDITGETPWVRSLIDRHHARAAAEGTRIVPCCGFDSVPSDLGVYLAVRHLRRRTGSPCRQARAFFQMRGGLNGGTVATGFHLQDSGQARQAGDPFLLSPDYPVTVEQREASQDPRGVHLDPEVQAWVGPHLMGPVNTRVVRRSAALLAEWGEPYGSEFTYQEYTKYGDGFSGRLQAGLITGGLALFDRGLRHRAARRVLRRVLPAPGAGPSDTKMNEGWFRCEVVAIAPDGRRARVNMTHQGDPGNRATVRLVCESALCLLADDDGPSSHPSLRGDRPRGGVLTPATAFGEKLAARLTAAGVIIDVMMDDHGPGGGGGAPHSTYQPRQAPR